MRFVAVAIEMAQEIFHVLLEPAKCASIIEHEQTASGGAHAAPRRAPAARCSHRSRGRRQHSPSKLANARASGKKPLATTTPTCLIPPRSGFPR